MPTLKLNGIVALGNDDSMGKGLCLPWPRISADMKHFKNTTGASPVIMGRKTYEGLGGVPLPGRPNIVLTSNPEMVQGFYIANNVAKAYAAACRFSSTGEAFVIGGMKTFGAFADRLDAFYVTEVMRGFPSADVFFDSNLLLPFKFFRELGRDESDISVAFTKYWR